MEYIVLDEIPKVKKNKKSSTTTTTIAGTSNSYKCCNNIYQVK
jgi:hypothetical protein